MQGSPSVAAELAASVVLSSIELVSIVKVFLLFLNSF
jgi:hypothetical protein